MVFCRFILVAFVVFVFAVDSWCEDINPVVGREGDFVLREADLERLLASQPPEVQAKLQTDPDQRASLVRQILLGKAVAARARKEGFDRKPEVKEQLSYVIDNYIAQEYLRKVVQADVPVADDDMKAYYKEHEKDFQVPESVHARHIFFSFPENASEEAKKAVREKADKALQRLKQGEDFAKVAAQVSEDKDTAEKGGDLGFISPGKTNSKEFETALFGLKTGETSAVVESPFGLHIIRIDERKEQRTATFSEAKDYIRDILKAQLTQKKTEDFLGQVTKESGLEVKVSPPEAEPKKKE